MEYLSDALREAVANPPPSTIDLDRLITGEQHRARRLRWFAAAAMVSLLATGVVVAPNLMAGGPMHGGAGGARCPGVTASSTAQPGDPKGPEPTEPCDAAVVRLAGAMLTVLGDKLPGATIKVTEPVRPGPDGDYSAKVEITDAQGTSVLAFRWGTSTPAGLEGSRAAYGCYTPAIASVQVPTSCPPIPTLPDGSAVVELDLPPFRDGMASRQLDLYRTDGTVVWLVSWNFRYPDDSFYDSVTASPPPPDPPGTMVALRPTPLTMEQLTAIADSPMFTLFP